jgi:ABC-type multidrug transport system fused ATPase/permease subunit
MLPLAGILIGLTGRTLKKTSQQGQQKIGLLLSFIEESISGLRIIKGFTAERFAKEKFDEMNNEYGKLATKMYSRRDLASPLSEFLGIAVFAIIIWYGGQLVFENQLTTGTFVAFLVLFYTIIAPAKAFSSAYYNIQKGVASVERIRVILDAPVNITDPENPIAITSFNDHIHYKNVSFAYHKGDHGWAVKGVDFRIERGKTIALVGQSGSGKSTLADLLPRFYDVTEGSILLDGHDIRNLTLNNLRSQIGVVTQESILFNETVHNNIAFGLEHKTKEEVIQAAKIANAHDFIMQLPEGYATNIGDRGNKLSGGQRQRLCIARAILRNPPILILDEATSALDTESEKLVQEALNNLMKNRTSIIIAHRLSTILHADEILVMQKGEIVERGNHTQLLTQNGVYKKLYDLQGF